MKRKFLESPGILTEKLKSMSPEDMTELASEIREAIVQTVNRNGGHLASNLGTVELTLSLFKIFDFPKRDVLVWDTGHQTYTHKILTDRYSDFNTLRTKNGISGYTNINESRYDAFGAGHVGTSIAAALGYEQAKQISREPGEVIAVIGDGALTSGNALEALNQVAAQKSKLKIIINDNGMAISDNVGSFANNFSLIRTAKGYNAFKKQLKQFLKTTHLTGLEVVLEWIKDNMRHNLIPKNIFENMGFKYIGPVDGHDMELMTKVLDNLHRYHEKPVILHVQTKKGRGIEYAEREPTEFHGVGPTEPATCYVEKMPDFIGYSDAFGYTVSRYADSDPKLVAITAAMEDGTGLKHFRIKHPERFFDLGITEQSCMTFAGALSLKGLHPVFAVYSTFAQRAYDQIIHDVALQKIPVLVGLDRAGIVGEDGPTHHGTFDIAFLLSIPGLHLLAPDSITTMIGILKYLLEKGWHVKHPTFIRYPREKEILGYDSIDEMIEETPEFNPFKWDKHLFSSEAGDDREIIVFAVGTMFHVAKEIAQSLETSVTVINVSSIKPLDIELISGLFRRRQNQYPKKKKLVMTIEEGMLKGGFGQFLLSYLNKHYRHEIDFFKSYGIDGFVPHGKRQELLIDAGLDSETILRDFEREVERTCHLRISYSI